jgi:hypothetical protein
VTSVCAKITPEMLFIILTMPFRTPQGPVQLIQVAFSSLNWMSRFFSMKYSIKEYVIVLKHQRPGWFFDVIDA